MAIEIAFNLNRRDVLTARDNYILQPVFDLNIALRMPDSSIARKKTAIIQRGVRWRLILLITLHDGVAA